MKFLIGCGAIIGGIFLRAFVLRQMWGWFIVKQFHTDPIGAGMALGISSTVQYLTSNDVPKEDPDTTKAIVHGLVQSILTLAFGWIYSRFL